MTDHVSLDELVALRGVKISTEKDPAKPYLGLKHLGAECSEILGSAASSASVSVNSVFESGDILFGKLRPNLRKCTRVDFNGYCSTDILVLVPRAGTDSGFAAHTMQSECVFSEAWRTAGGTKMPRTSWGDLRRVHVRRPPVADQQQIAQILDALDHAIRSTDRLIAKVSLMEQGLLTDVLTRGIDANGQLRDAVSRPEQFKHTQLGSLPVDWDVSPVADVLHQRPKNGYSPQEVDEWTGTWMLGLGCLTPSGFIPCQLKMAPKDDPALRPALLQDGDLLMSRSNTRELVGLVGRYQDVGAPCTYPDLMMRLVPNDRVSATFLEIALRGSSSRRQIRALASGTSGSMVKISSTTAMGVVVVVPNREEQERIVAAVGRLSMMKAKETANLAKLRQLRKGLKDDLLSGRVRVSYDDESAA